MFERTFSVNLVWIFRGSVSWHHCKRYRLTPELFKVSNIYMQSEQDEPAVDGKVIQGKG